MLCSILYSTNANLYKYYHIHYYYSFTILSQICDHHVFGGLSSTDVWSRAETIPAQFFLSKTELYEYRDVRKQRYHCNIMIHIHDTMLMQCLIYCCEIWGFNYPTHRNKISTIQKMSTGLITHSPFKCHTHHFHKDTQSQYLSPNRILCL